MPALPNMFTRRGVTIVVIAVTLVVALFAHTPLLNGPYYWKWPWRRLPIGRIFLIAASLLPLFLGLWAGKSSRRVGIALLMLGTIALRLNVARVQDPQLAFDWLDAVVRSPSATSYYIDAAALNAVHGWLAVYPSVLNQLHLHTQSKPPGPVAWYVMWIRLLGYGRTSAIISAVALALFQSLIIPCTYGMIRRLTRRRRAAFFGSAFIAFCPAASLAFPAMDPAYAVLTCAIVVTADLAIRSNLFRNALLAGVVLAAAAFCSYAVLTLGTFLIAYACVKIERKRLIHRTPLLIFGISLGLAMFYGILWLTTRFDPVATFLAAWRNQHALLLAHANERPYPLTAVFDLTDFALGIGWVGLFAVLGGKKWRWLCLLCIAQPVLIAATGLLQSETFRVWNFMLPLLAIPAGLAMERWSAGDRRWYFVAAGAVMIAIAANLIFMSP